MARPYPGSGARWLKDAMLLQKFSAIFDPEGAAAADRVVVTWEGPGEPIMLTVYGPDGELAVPLLPKRCLTLAQELLTRGVQPIKVYWPG